MFCCSVCGKEEGGTTATLLCCSRCKRSDYFVCGVDCQRSDWKRHKREECLVVKIEDGLPKEACVCHRCRAGSTDIGDDDVSEFFNDLHMVRGRPGVWKIINDQQIPLTKGELDLIAYPYARFTHMGACAIMCIPEEPKTFHAPDGKGFTVGQLAGALAKAEECNIDKHGMIGAVGGGWYFEGFRRGKDPHTFGVRWGTNMVSRRVGVGFGLNHINTRASGAVSLTNEDIRSISRELDMAGFVRFDQD